MPNPKIVQEITALQEDTASIKTLVSPGSITIDNIPKEIYNLKIAVRDLNNTINNLTSNVTISTLSVGDEFYIREQGVLVPFILIQKGTTQSNTTAIAIRKSLLPLRIYHYSNSLTTYNSSDINSYLVNTYPGLLSVTLTNTYIDVTNSSGNTSSVYTQCFLPSVRELLGGSNGPAEGSQFTYFNSNSKRIAEYDGVARAYHTRTLASSSQNYRITSAGSYNSESMTNNAYVRPCIALSTTTTVLQRLTTANVLATATVV